MLKTGWKYYKSLITCLKNTGLYCIYRFKVLILFDYKNMSNKKMKVMKKLLLLLNALFFISGYGFSQVFEPIDASTSLPQVTFSQLSWVDYDNDGDLDVLVFGMEDAGSYKTGLFENKGNDTFEEVTDAGFENLGVGSCAWGDYDNDGDVDLLIQGADSNIDPFTTVYRNDGSGIFTDIEPGINQVYQGNERWADFNNDGYLDILSAGFNGTDYETKIYKNNGDGTFSEEAGITLPGVINSTVEWCDYDKDGDMDFILMGDDINGNFVTTLYKNNGDGTFEDSGMNFPQVFLSDAAWGDYNNDGYPDLVIAGFVYPGRITNLYKNNGDGTLTLVDDSTFQKVSHCALEWGDYDNDGDLDLFLAGTEENDDGSWSYYTYIYDNNGNGTFQNSGIELPPMFWGDAAWGDYNNDGKLDLIQTGYNEYYLAQTVIYKNTLDQANTKPTAPSGLTAEIDSSSVTLSWNAATDQETPQDALSYNIYLYKYNGDTICPSNSINSTGYRLTPTLMGNACQNTSWKINGLTDGTYFWSVQSIDNALEGSEFAEEGSFTIDVTGIETPVCISSDVYPNPAKDNININLGDLTIEKVSLTNVNGQTVLTKAVNAKSYNLNLQNIVPGVYFLKIKTASDIFTEKVVKE